MLDTLKLGGENIIDEEGKIPRVEDQDHEVLDEFTEEDFLLNEEDDDETQPLTERKWIKKIVASLVAVVLLGNLLAFFPLVFNLQAIEFLKTTRELSKSEAIQQYKKAIVVVKADNRKGTGFNINEQGLIITNEHVVGDAKVALINFDERGIYKAEVIIADASIDIAILRIIHKENEPIASIMEAFPTLPIETVRTWEVGMPIYVIGNPLFFNRIANEGTVMGLIEIEDWEMPVMAIQAPIYKGNSGSPIINLDGNVIAVVFATTKVVHEGNKIKAGLAIPIEYLVKYIQANMDEGV